MDFEEAFKLADAEVFAKTGKHLNSAEATVIRGAWNNQTYEEMAVLINYAPNYLHHDVGPKLWKLLTEVFEEDVNKQNCRVVILRRSPTSTANSVHLQPIAESKFPEGEVSLDSPFYISRPPIESLCYEEILQSGALIRIKAPEQMGKTLLLSRILGKAREQDYQTITLDFQLADSTVLTDIRKFLQWICANASDILELPDRVDEFWQDTLGENRNCTRYFQKYLLKEIPTPLVLGLDNVDLVFEQAAIVNDFCKLLRGWHEQAKESDRIGDTWKKMRLVVVHSTEVYRTMDINSSPLANVGITFDLPDFSSEQLEDLAGKYGLNLNQDQIVQLIDMVGGHPALVRTAFDCVKRQNISIEQVLKTAPTEEGVFSGYLRKHLQNLREHPELAEAFSVCVASTEPIELKSEFTFKLHRMGLVNLLGNSVTPRCNLYRRYFQQSLKK